MKKAKYTVFVTGWVQDKNGRETPFGCDFLPCIFESNSRNARKHLLSYLSLLEKFAFSVGHGATVSYMTCIIYTDYGTPSETPISRATYDYTVGDTYPLIVHGAYKPID